MEHLASKNYLFKESRVAMKSSEISGARDDILVYRSGRDGCNEITIFVDTLQQFFFYHFH